MWLNQYNCIGRFLSLDLFKDCMLTCSWNVQKAQSRKWCKSIKYSRTGTRPRVSCVRGKYANHLHHTGFMISLTNCYIQIHNIYIYFLYNLIHNNSHLWPCLTYAFKAPEVDRKYVLLLPEMFLHKKKPRIYYGVKHQHMEHILPQSIYWHQRQREVFHNVGEWFFHR